MRIVLGLSALAALVRWLPGLVVRLRVWVFTRINGEEGIALPGPGLGTDAFRRLYADPSSGGRSRGAALSDLFWYWLSPGPEMHQEHLEAGPRYEAIAHCTRQILALSKRDAEHRARASAAKVLGEGAAPARALVRLRDQMMPIWADFYHELVFGEPCPRSARDRIVAHADDVVAALKLTRLRHLKRRLALTHYLKRRIEAGGIPHPLPEGFTSLELAYYLQGVFFNTAIVQMSEAMAHLLLAIAEHPEVQARLVDNPADDRYLDQVITESLRLYPLFGVAHRITTAPIAIPDRILPTGSVLCFNYQAFHQDGFEEASSFRPERWEKLNAREVNYLPFGMPGNRPCPAQAIALVTMRAVAREVMERFWVASSAPHNRSLPHRGPCLWVRRDRPRRPWREKGWLLYLRLSEAPEDLVRSVVQLVLGVAMILDARRLRLCQRHFDPEPASRCPFARFARRRAVN